MHASQYAMCHAICFLRVRHSRFGLIDPGLKADGADPGGVKTQGKTASGPGATGLKTPPLDCSSHGNRLNVCALNVVTTTCEATLRSCSIGGTKIG